MAENAAGPIMTITFDKSCTASIKRLDGTVSNLAVQTYSLLDETRQQLNEIHEAGKNLITPQAMANRFAAPYSAAAQFAQEQTDAKAAQGAPSDAPAQKTDEAAKKYNQVMGGALRPLGERVQASFGDGLQSLLTGWSDGVLSVVTGKQQIGPAFQKLFTTMRNKLRDFLVKSIAEQTGAGLLNVLGFKTSIPENAKAAAKAGDPSASAQTDKKDDAAVSSGTSANGNGTTGGGSAGTGNGLSSFIDSLFTSDSLLGTIWSKISDLFKPEGLLGGLMSSISGLFSSLFKPEGPLGGMLSGLASFISMLFHTGGIVGETGRPGRMVSAGLFAGAPRFHTGGLVAGEVPIIARKGEAVFTPEQMTNADRLIQAAQDGGRAVTQSVTVNVAGGSTGDREQDKALAERIGASVKEQLRAMMGNELRQQMRPGGMLNNMSYGG
ncbi:hypothetical protein ACHMW5_07870 (plasmid) [Azospirillum melinis]|uniref:hypothetical protein n=1 Tax=Azospirillum melinis TaxID=328839 RepID=UPI003757995A